MISVLLRSLKNVPLYVLYSLSYPKLSIQRRDSKSEKDAQQFYDRCCKHYKLANSMDKAAECLVKVAKVMEKVDINATAGYMLRACNLFVVCPEIAMVEVEGK